MKRLLVLLLVIGLVAVSAFAASKTGVGSVTYNSTDDAATYGDVVGTNATLPVKFENTAYTEVEIGFASAAPTSVSQDMSSSVIGSEGVVLAKDDGATTASYGTGNGNALYLYWQIVSADALNLKLSFAGTDANGALVSADPSAKLDWGVYQYSSSASDKVGNAMITSGESGTATANIETDHNPTSASGGYGGQQIVIKTADYSKVPFGTYTGTLKLEIISAGN